MYLKRIFICLLLSLSLFSCTRTITDSPETQMISSKKIFKLKKDFYVYSFDTYKENIDLNCVEEKHMGGFPSKDDYLAAPEKWVNRSDCWFTKKDMDGNEHKCRYVKPEIHEIAFTGDRFYVCKVEQTTTIENCQVIPYICFPDRKFSIKQISASRLLNQYSVPLDPSRPLSFKEEYVEEIVPTSLDDRSE